MSDLPNVFLVGAPKCGTTTIAGMLAEHPEVAVSDPKEPCFWSVEVGERPPSSINEASIRRYAEKFSGSTGKAVRMDASTSYCWSRTALPLIEKHIGSQCRYIMMVRNPVEMALSLHAEELYACHEDLPGFEDAWTAQADRRAGRRLPAGVRTPMKLQYKYICSLGSHLEHVRAHAGERLLHVVVLDDLRSDPDRIVRGICDFLEVPHVSLSPRVSNVRKRHRFPSFSRYLLRPPRMLRPLEAKAKKLCRRMGLAGLRSNMLRAVAARNGSHRLSPALRRTLVEEFEPEVLKLEGILGRRFEAWRR